MISESEYQYLKFLYLTDCTKFNKDISIEKKQDFFSMELTKTLNKNLEEVKIKIDFKE